jgi:hypothetical protein
MRTQLQTHISEALENRSVRCGNFVSQEVNSSRAEVVTKRNEVGIEIFTDEDSCRGLQGHDTV